MAIHRSRSVGPLARLVMRSLGAAALAAVMAALASAQQPGQETPASTTSESTTPTGKAVEEYWTPERMKEAKPIPMPHPDASKSVPATEKDAPAEPPMALPGETPKNQKEQPD